jgi:hypothetical protein
MNDSADIENVLSRTTRWILPILVIARQIHLALGKNKNHFHLKIPKMNIDFADCIQGYVPISLQADSIGTKYDSFRAS